MYIVNDARKSDQRTQFESIAKHNSRITINSDSSINKMKAQKNIPWKTSSNLKTGWFSAHTQIPKL